MRDAFSHVEHWVFDLDNTLYPPSARLFDQIELRMTDWVMEVLGVARDEANRLRVHYWQLYGTTLAGLMTEHGVDPAPYLTHVHDISLDHLEKDPALRRRIRALPGRRIVFTNGSAEYAAPPPRVAGGPPGGSTGSSTRSTASSTPVSAPKPEAAAFAAVFDMAALDPALWRDVRGRRAQSRRASRAWHAHRPCRPRSQAGAAYPTTTPTTSRPFCRSWSTTDPR